MPRFYISDGAHPGKRIALSAWRKSGRTRQSDCLSEAQAIARGRISSAVLPPAGYPMFVTEQRVSTRFDCPAEPTGTRRIYFRKQAEDADRVYYCVIAERNPVQTQFSCTPEAWPFDYADFDYLENTTPDAVWYKTGQVWETAPNWVSELQSTFTGVVNAFPGQFSTPNPATYAVPSGYHNSPVLTSQSWTITGSETVSIPGIGALP